MVSYSIDDMLVLALKEIKLQNQVLDPPKPTGAEDEDYQERLAVHQKNLELLRTQYNDARCEIMLRTPAIWCTKRETLSVDAALEAGWYRLPADFLGFVGVSRVIDVGQDQNGETIYKLPGPDLYYIYDSRREDRDPLFQKAVRYCFLSKLCMSEDSASVYFTVIVEKERKAYSDYTTWLNTRKGVMRNSDSSSGFNPGRPSFNFNRIPRPTPHGRGV